MSGWKLSLVLVPLPNKRVKLTAPVRLALVLLPLSWISPNGQDADIVGSWRGTSICVDRVQFPACKDEQVVYDVRRKGSAQDTVTLRADKVVNGVREFMAEFDFSRAPDSTWVTTYESPRIRIRIVLRVRGSQMTGVLTDEPSARRVREIAVARVT